MKFQTKTAFVSEGVYLFGYIAESHRTPAVEFAFAPPTAVERAEIVTALTDESKTMAEKEAVAVQMVADRIKWWNLGAVNQDTVGALSADLFGRITKIVLYDGKIDTPPPGRLDECERIANQAGANYSTHAVEAREKN